MGLGVQEGEAMNPYSLVVKCFRDSMGRYWMETRDVERLCRPIPKDSSILLEVEVKKIVKGKDEDV